MLLLSGSSKDEGIGKSHPHQPCNVVTIGHIVILGLPRVLAKQGCTAPPSRYPNITPESLPSRDVQTPSFAVPKGLTNNLNSCDRAEVQHHIISNVNNWVSHHFNVNIWPRHHAQVLKLFKSSCGPQLVIFMTLRCTKATSTTTTASTKTTANFISYPPTPTHKGGGDIIMAVATTYLDDEPLMRKHTSFILYHLACQPNRTLSTATPCWFFCDKAQVHIILTSSIWQLRLSK